MFDTLVNAVVVFSSNVTVVSAKHWSKRDCIDVTFPLEFARNVALISENFCRNANAILVQVAIRVTYSKCVMSAAPRNDVIPVTFCNSMVCTPAFAYAKEGFDTFV